MDRGEEDIDGIEIYEGDAIFNDGHADADEAKEYFKIEISQTHLKSILSKARKQRLST